MNLPFKFKKKCLSLKEAKMVAFTYFFQNTVLADHVRLAFGAKKHRY